jgi:limonene-1,2-epoxide hydrolase
MDNFMTAWKNQDVEAVMQTIADDCEYYETVFEKPCQNISEIKKLWEVVPTNQKNIEYSYEIISENKNFCLINFLVKRTMISSEEVQEIDGIFQVAVNEDDQCTFFKQWRAVK